MMRDVTIGQYYPKKSLIHSLDPRVKLFWTILFLVTVFLINNTYVFLLVSAVLFTYIGLSRVPFKYMARGLRAILVILVLTFAFSLFLTSGKDVLFQAGPLKATGEGLVLGTTMVIRLCYLVLGASVLTLTTTPNQLTDGLESGFAWLKFFHVPVSEVAMMMTIALRFIPILSQEMDRIMKAQTARGADFETGNLIQRAKALTPLIVPLFVAAIRRADDLAMAMESRCYHGGEGRTKMKPLKYKGRDIAVYFGMAVYLAAVILLRTLG